MLYEVITLIMKTVQTQHQFRTDIDRVENRFSLYIFKDRTRFGYFRIVDGVTLLQGLYLAFRLACGEVDPVIDQRANLV